MLKYLIRRVIIPCSECEYFKREFNIKVLDNVYLCTCPKVVEKYEKKDGRKYDSVETCICRGTIPCVMNGKPKK